MLTALVLLSFGRSLTGYFLADDFGVARYAQDIISGRVDLLLHNWIGNFNNVPGMAVYRPWQMNSWVTDVFLWKGNAAGYYATNLLYYTGDTILLFLVCRQLTKQWHHFRSIVASFFAAAMFAVNPLHCESVSWMIGRVDIECCFYYLIGLLAYLRYRTSHRTSWVIVSTLGFWLGMFVKEMAIGLPVMAFAISFLGINAQLPQTQPSLTLKKRFVTALRESSPLLLSTLAYFIVRYLALGTLTGGYTGSIGDGQASSAVARWLDPETYSRVFLPFAISLFHRDNLWLSLLGSSYAAMLAIFAVKCMRREVPGQLMLFFAAWIATCALPIYKLWGLGMDLEGARFCFFLTASFSAATAVLLLSPDRAEPLEAPASRRLQSQSTAIVTSAALAIAAVCLYKACLRTNATWVHAGKEVHALMKSAAVLSQQAQPNHKILVLGIPQRNVSAHMIYNGATFWLGLRPPVSARDYSKPFVTFNPISYGPGEFVNSARLKSYMSQPTSDGPYVWNSKQNAFLPCVFNDVSPAEATISLTGTQKSADVQAYSEGHATVRYSGGSFVFTDVLPGDGLQFNNLNIDPRHFDFIQLEYKAAPGSHDLRFGAGWRGKHTSKESALPHADSLPAGRPSSDGFRMLRIPVSHYWRWFTDGNVTSIYLTLPVVHTVSIRNVLLLSDKQLRPALAALDNADDGLGVHYVGKYSHFNLDASAIPGASSLLFECSKPDYFFDQIDPLKQQSAVYKHIVLNGNRFSGALPDGFVPKGRYCELRVRALAASGEALGEYSEPVIIFQN